MKRSIAAWIERRMKALDPPPRPELPLCVLPEMLDWTAARRVLAFAPHPDDECIGCGGLLNMLALAGVALRVVLVTDGSGAGGLPAGAGVVRQQEFLAALELLGVTDHGMLDFPDGGLSPSQALLAAVETEVRAFRPDWVVGPSAADAHRDHRCVALAVQTAAQGCPDVDTVLSYETWGPLPASHVLDITDTLSTKLAALSQHKTALEQMDYLQATTGLARYRGLLLRHPRQPAAAEAYLCTRRDTGFAWPAGLGRPEGWPEFAP